MNASANYALRVAAVGGIIAGTVDIGAASLINWLNPVIILQAVASGWRGNDAFHEGASSAALGYLLQCVMSAAIAAIFAVASTQIATLRRRWVIAGTAYGVGVFIVMNYVVVPLSAIGHSPHFTVRGFLENLLAMLLFGLIISCFAREPAPRS